jgi:hypothetical protein
VVATSWSQDQQKKARPRTSACAIGANKYASAETHVFVTGTNRRVTSFDFTLGGSKGMILQNLAVLLIATEILADSCHNSPSFVLRNVLYVV